MGVDLTKGTVLGTIYRTSAPLVIANVLQTTLTLVDTLFVGKLGSNALAAVGIGFPVFLLITLIGSSLGVGVVSLVSRRIGSGERNKAKSAAEHGVLAAVALSLCLTVVLYATAPYLVEFMGGKGHLREYTLQYLNIIILLLFFQVTSLVLNNIVCAEGEMKISLKWGAITNVVNLVLDPILIFSFGLGLQGAAYATVISQVLGLLYLLRYFLSEMTWVKINFKDFKVDSKVFKEIFSISIPVSLSNMALSFSAMVHMGIVGLFGPHALAASAIGFRLYGLAALPGQAISNATVSIVGQSLGSRKIKRAREAIVKSGLMSSVLMSSIGVLFFVFASQAIQIFNSEPDVLSYGISFLRIVPLSFPFRGMGFCFGSALVAAGKGKQILLLKLCKNVFPLIPTYLLALKFGVPGIWAGFALGQFIYFLVTYILYKYGGWEYERKIKGYN